MAIDPTELTQPARDPALRRAFNPFEGGKVFGQDPHHLAIFLAPIMDLIRPGSGPGLFAAGVQGLTRRDALQAEIAERAEARRERQGELASRQADREADNRRQALSLAIQNPRAIPFLRGLPEFRDIDLSGLEAPPGEEATFEHPGYPGTKFTRAEYVKLPPIKSDEKKPPKVKVQAGGQELEVSPEAALGYLGRETESPRDRLTRLRAELKDIVDKGREGMDARVRQIAPILGLDANQQVKAYQQSVRARLQKERKEEVQTRRTEALITRALRSGGGEKPEKLTPAARGQLAQEAHGRARDEVLGPSWTRTGSPTAEQIAEIDRRAEEYFSQSVQRALRPVGAPAGAPAAPVAAPKKKTISKAQIQDYARRFNMTYEQAAKKATGEGYTIK